MAKKKSNTTPPTPSPKSEPKAKPKPKVPAKVVTALAAAAPKRTITLEPLKLPGAKKLYFRILRDVSTLPSHLCHDPVRKWHNPSGEHFEITVHAVRDSFYLTDLRDGVLVEKGQPNPPKTPAPSTEKKPQE